MNFDIRSPQSDDIAFIYATWLNSQKYDSDIGLSTTKTVFFEEYRTVIDHILAKDTTKVLIACDKQHPSTIFGYIVYEPDVVHYVVVKEAFWNLKIASTLLKTAFPQGVGVTSHKTDMALPYIAKLNLIYNPFLLYARSLINE